MSKIKIKISLFLSYFVLAILLNTVGIVIAQVIDDYNVSRLTAGTLEAFKDLSIMVVSFALASFVPKFGYRRTLIYGLIAITFGCMLIASITEYWAVPILYMITGSSFALMKISVYSTVGLITKSQQEHTGFMNTLEGVFMTGSLVGPLLFSVMISISHWNNTYWVISILTTLALILMLFTEIDESQVKEEAKDSSFIKMFSLLKYPMVWVFILCAFLYVMIEQSFGTWLPTFNREIFKLSQAQSASFLSIYAGSIALSRFIAGYLSRRFSWLSIQLFYLVGAFLLTLIVLIQTIDLTATEQSYWYHAPPLAFVFSMVGFFLGPIYPTICSIVLSKLETSRHSSMTGLIIVFSAIGGTSGSMIIGVFSHNFSVHNAFYFPLIPIVLLAFMLIPYKKLSDKFELEHHK
ncbi:MAG: MFS transporter [Melioribacteraceae bacterium]|nr:MFS transporter [Melioribacteraceae bacterium]